MERFFEWDDNKAKSNLQRHGISFDEAAKIFDDPLCLSEQDRIENGEKRWATIGLLNGCVLLLVAHTIFEDDSIEVLRIISARHADKKERKRYEHGQI